MGVEKEHEGPLFKLSQQAKEDSHRWFPQFENDLGHHVLCLCGEAGEVANIVKKLEEGRLNLRDAETRFKLMMEITDVQTYLLSIAGMIGLDLDKSLQHVRAENEKRFGKDKK